MEENLSLRQALEQFSAKKADIEELIPGLIGVTMGGAQQIECPRVGYVWVRLHGSNSEFIQAYNDVIAYPFYNLPVYVSHNPINQNTYYIVSNKELSLVTTTNRTFSLPYYDNSNILHNLVGGSGVSKQNQVLISSTSNPTWQLRNHPIWFTDGQTNAGYDGDAVAVGTYTMTGNAFNSNISTNATALVMTLEAIWAAPGTAYARLRTAGAAQNGICIRAHDALNQDSGPCVVPLDVNHQFNLQVGITDTTYLKITVWGYWITGTS